MIKILNILIIVSTLFVISAEASQLEQEVAKLKKKMDQRQSLVTSLKKSLLNLKRLKVNAFDPPVTIQKASATALVCKIGWFRWGGKKPDVEYKDCSYKYSPTKKEDVDRLAESIKLHMFEGWEIDRSELFNQNIITPNNIINIDRYRYIRNVRK